MVIVKNVFLLQIYWYTPVESLLQAWSLATVASFYVVLPLIAIALIRRSRRRTLLLLAGTALITPLWVWGMGLIPLSGYWGASVWLPAKFGWFAAGMALALLAPRYRLTPSGRFNQPAIWLIAALLVFLAVVHLGRRNSLDIRATVMQDVTQQTLYVVFAFLVLGFVLHPRARSTPVGWMLAHPAMVWVGRVSYPLFLVHMLIIHALQGQIGATEHGDLLILLILTIGISLVVSALLHQAIEEPIMRWVNGGTEPLSTPRQDASCHT